jgi:hypothetical protein
MVYLGKRRGTEVPVKRRHTCVFWDAAKQPRKVIIRIVRWFLCPISSYFGEFQREVGHGEGERPALELGLSVLCIFLFLFVDPFIEKEKLNYSPCFEVLFSNY